MAAIIIKTDAENSKILKALARKLGASVININDQDYEDFLLGTSMEKVKTGEVVAREAVIKKLWRK